MTQDIASAQAPEHLANDAVPLFVDVDGTLIRADLSLESFVHVARSGLTAFFGLFLWLFRGRAVAKSMAARYMPVNAASLPYRQEVVDLIEQAKAEGRPVILASASHWRHILRIARHLGLDEAIIGSCPRANLKGQAKLTAIYQRIGVNSPFDYAGDSRADISLWRAAQTGWTTGHMPDGMGLQRLGNPPASLPRSLLRAMRPHQWAKNALVLVPLLTSGLFTQPVMLTKALMAALFMSLIASSIYLINDLLDIESDRKHRTKWKRPLAHGDLSIPAAIIASVLLALIGLGGAIWMGGAQLCLWLMVYMVLTTAYSLRIKAMMVGDTIVLASLYTVRIWIGGVAIGVSISYWLLLFSIFMFLSLAYLKRYIEMRDVQEPEKLLSGRGYVGGDLDVVMMSGISSGMVSVLVLSLFAHDAAAMASYAAPHFLWLLCIPLLYWHNRIWMMARRGEVEGDPVAFAISDRRSIMLGGIMAIIFLLALYGYPISF